VIRWCSGMFYGLQQKIDRRGRRRHNDVGAQL